jgi:hypothetical protein
MSPGCANAYGTCSLHQWAHFKPPHFPYTQMQTLLNLSTPAWLPVASWYLQLSWRPCLAGASPGWCCAADRCPAIEEDGCASCTRATKELSKDVAERDAHVAGKHHSGADGTSGVEGGAGVGATCRHITTTGCAHGSIWQVDVSCSQPHGMCSQP